MKLRITLITALVIFSVKGQASDLDVIVKLSGSWKFSIGDSIAWAGKNFNHDKWDEVIVPGSWESNGYVGYNGYAWYRKKFIIDEYYEDKTFYLDVGKIDDVDEVYINGHKIGSRGIFPPHYKTAYNQHRIYSFPASYLDKENIIAVRVYDKQMDGGLIDNVNLCVDYNNSMLEVDLSGEWKFKTSHNKKWKDPDYNDSDWENIFVPMNWESQNYEEYDGYAWYRKTFTVPDNLTNQDLMLVLGKIDDIDIVYLNGKILGSVLKTIDDQRPNRQFINKKNAWNVLRSYEIPKELIRENNTICIAVYDTHGKGGIYKGPVGIMTKRNFARSGLDDSPFGKADNIIEAFIYELIY